MHTKYISCSSLAAAVDSTFFVIVNEILSAHNVEKQISDGKGDVSDSVLVLL